MLSLVVREAAPTVAKVAAEAVVKVIEKHPVETVALAAAWLFGYQKGRADAFGEFLNFKRNSM